MAGTWGQTIVGTLDPTKKYFFRGSGNSNIIIKVGTPESIKDIGETGSVINGFSYAFYYLQFPKSGTTFNNVTIYPQINEGTTLLDYEPYTGGKPSPSSECPQEIQTVVNPVIKTYGKNLLKVTFQDKMQDGVTCTNNGDGTYTLNGTATRQTDFSLFGNYDSTVRIPTDIRKTYIIKKSGKSNIQFHVGVANKYTVTCATEDGLIENKAGISYFICRILSGTTLNNFTIYPQIEEGSVSTDFKPYQESQATLPYELYAIPVSSGGNVTIDGRQYIADYVDVEKGVLVRNVNHVILKGISGYELIGSRHLFFFENNTPAKKTIYNGYCRYYIASGNLEDKHVRFEYTRVYIMDNSITNKSEFDSKYENGLEFAYVLDVPVEIDIMEEQIEAFKALSTYYPKTYINEESEQLEAYTMFNYPVSMEKGWEYVKQQIGDTRKYVYDMDTKLTETEASTLEAKIDTAILSEMIGG